LAQLRVRGPFNSAVYHRHSSRVWAGTPRPHYSEHLLDPNAQIRAQIDAFVSGISTRVRRAALDAVASALGSPAPAPAKRGPGRPPKAVASDEPAAAPKRAAKRGKRTPEDVAKMGETVVAYVAKNPGQSVEQIKKALGVEKKDLQLPIIRMIAAKKLKTTGQKRGTKYFAR
jgi:hypothetical protein